MAQEDRNEKDEEKRKRRFFFRDLWRRVDAAFTGRGRIDAALFEEFEAALLSADISMDTTERVLENLREFVQDQRVTGVQPVQKRLEELLVEALGDPGDTELAVAATPPTLYLMVGVNGVGKTTSLGKMAYQATADGKKVMLVAGDTFRAAAAEQLAIWAERTGADFIRQHERSDPAAVVFDAINAAKTRGVDLILVDTAGRLHTKSNLMEELRKIGRVCERELGRKPDEVLLALDATTGQNALRQAQEFMSAVGVTGIVLTKLDGTARGGIVITLREKLGVPIKMVGVGEQPDDLVPFYPELFIQALLDVDDEDEE
ncbi:MAG: signal recognition particle-docking protein FtsY [Armatimonadaceae bacterium]